MKDIIKKLNMLYYEINNIYMEMYNFEVSSKKDDLFFLELVNLLKDKREKEKELFNEFDKVYEGDYIDLCESLSNSVSPFNKRMVDYLNVRNTINISIYEEDEEEVVSDKLKLVRYAKLCDVCSKNILLIYLSFLQEYIDSKMYDYLRDKLLSFKYHNSFINHDIENYLIDFNFNIGMVNYVDLYLVADSLGLEKDVCDDIILDCYLNNILLVIEQLLSFNDKDLDDIDKMSIFVNNQCMFRASLSLLSERDYDRIKDIIFNKIKELSNENNRINVDIINSILFERKKDKSRVRKISMRPIDD